VEGDSVITATDLEQLVEGAKAVLHGNDLGRTTKPAPGLYPHQWNWDSCFIAIGIAHYDSERAADEIRGLLRGQWKNGLVPQIIFNPKGTGYFPGPDVWQSKRSPDAPTDVETSGITQPAVLATAALRIWQTASDKDAAKNFLSEVYPGILRFHRFLYEERNPGKSGLIVVVHPWESGLDNSPPYLDAGSRVQLKYHPKYERLDTLHVDAKNRPTNKDYDLFVYLLELMREVNWDQKRYLQDAPLQVEDVLFGSVLCRANSDLAEIAEIVGENPSQARDWHEQTKSAVNKKLWDESDGTYYSWDRVADHALKDDTIAAFHTLYGGIATPERAKRMVQEHLLDPDGFWPSGGYPVPTTAMSSPWFNPENYWLGPTWVNTNWMVLRGLESYGYEDLAHTIRDQTLDLVRKGGYREYYNPRTGEGYGTDSFSWTSALTIDLAVTSEKP
jgi:neutral trehalase